SWTWCEVPMTDFALRIRDVGKEFRRGSQKEGRIFEWLKGKTPYEYFWALRHINVDVERGQMLGIIGHNGAGKSTLLRVASRITRPTEGSVELRGRVGTLLDVGTGFHPELTGIENIQLNATVLGIPSATIKAKTEEIVAFAGVEDFIKTPLKYYSSGMRVRLGMAIALNLPHEIMLVDEVLAVGDASFREKCLDRISEVTNSGRTVLFVGHNMEMIASTCDTAIWLEKGSIKASGPASIIVQEYQEAAVKDVSAKDGLLSLSGRPDHGNGKLRLTYVRLQDGQGGTVQDFRSGQNVRFSVGFERDPRSSLGAVSLVMTLFGQGRVAVGQCDSTCVTSSFSNLPAAGEFTCSIDRLPLLPGRYSLGVKCLEGDEVVHGVPHAGSFFVFEGDFYGTGTLPSPGGGNALIDHGWEVSAGSGAGPTHD
ncbi:MAG: ABC transporter ATP-binding protein, partial [Gemmatimonadetes bacterium]|nr:ABC transporter ATP-binding protein [Gemmatimonadota bacterium]